MSYSLPNALDYQKQGLAIQKDQRELLQSRMDALKNAPGAYEAEMGLVDDFSQGSQVRKSGWRALLDGMASGLKYGLKSAEANKKREAYAKMEKLFASLEAANQQLQQQNGRNQQRQEDMETKVIPSAIGYLTYLQSNPSYEEAFTNLNSRVEQIKTVMPFEGELVALSPRNYEVGIFKDRKTGQLKETPISSLLPPDLLKGRPDLNTYERGKDAQYLALEREKVAALKERAKAGVMRAHNNKQSLEAQRADEEETQTYLELHKLLKNPNVDPTSSTGAGIKSWVAQNVPVVGKLAEDGLAERHAYSQRTADLKGLAFKKHGYRNQAEFENIHTLPDALPREEALKVVEHELRKKGINVSQMGEGATGGGNAAIETRALIKVQDPSTGQIGLLSPGQAKIAIQRGGVKVE